jgi:hypothetical protein
MYKIFLFLDDPVGDVAFVIADKVEVALVGWLAQNWLAGKLFEGCFVGLQLSHISLEHGGFLVVELLSANGPESLGVLRRRLALRDYLSS